MRGANCFVAPTLYDPENDSMLNFKNQNDPIKRGSSNRAFFVHREKCDRPRGTVGRTINFL